MGCGDSKVLVNLRFVDITHFEVHTTIGKGGFGHVHMVVKKTGEDKDVMYAQKRQIIHDIAKKHMQSEIYRELDFLKDLRHPFLCNAHYAFHDSKFTYLIMDLALGGDMRFHIIQHIKKGDGFTKIQVQFFTACIVSALSYVHACGVLHRDIKPDNFLMGADGYLKLTDFGISAFVDKKVMICTDSSGTHGYMAPEVYKRGNRHGVPSEAYSVGICVHEFVGLRRPFATEYSRNNADLLKTVHPTTRQNLNSYTSEVQQGLIPDFKAKILPKSGADKYADNGPEVHDFLSSLLHIRPSKRLGYEGGMESIKKHGWLKDIDWQKLENKKIDPPFKPNTDQRNASGFSDDIADCLDEGHQDDDIPDGTEKELAHFLGYHFNTEIEGAPMDSKGGGQVAPAEALSGRDRQMQEKPFSDEQLREYNLEEEKIMFPDQDETSIKSGLSNLGGLEEHHGEDESHDESTIGGS